MSEDPQRQGTVSGEPGSRREFWDLKGAQAEAQRRLCRLREERLEVPVLLGASEERQAACHFPLHPSIEIMFISYGKPRHFTEKKP